MKRMTKISALFFSGLLAWSMLTGCGSGSGGGSTQQQSKESAGAQTAGQNEGGKSTASGESGKDSLRFSINADIVSLDPAAQKDTVSGMIASQIFDTLVRCESDGTIVPGLAKSWEFGEDGKVVTFTLEEGVKFHNGETMTAEDVAFSINRAMENPMTSNVSGALDHAEADGEKVKLYMKDSFGPIIEGLSLSYMSVVSKKAVEEMGEEAFAKNPVGTGAYQFVEWKNGEKIVLKAFDDYWRGTPAIKDVTFMIMTDKNTAAIALQNEEVDILYDPDIADRATLEAADNLKLEVASSAPHFYMIGFNTRDSKFFSDVRVRRAVAMALNREDILIGAADGNGVTVTCPITPASIGYQEDYEFYPQDIEGAKALLAEAGYPDGFTVTMKLNQSSLYTKPAEIVQEQLRQIGITVEFELMERATYLEVVQGKGTDYDITLYMFSAVYTDPDYIFYGRVHSSNIGSSNYTNYNNPKADELVMEGRYSMEEAHRLEVYRELCDVIREDVPFIPLFAKPSSIAFNNKLSGVKSSPSNRYYIHEYSWNE